MLFYFLVSFIVIMAVWAHVALALHWLALPFKRILVMWWFHCKADNLIENANVNDHPRYPCRGSIVLHMKYCTTIQRLVWWMWISYPENLLMITLLKSWCVFGMVISSMLVFWFVCIACNTCLFWFSLKVSWAETHKEAKAGVYSVNFYDDEGFAAFRKVSWLLLLMSLLQWYSN